MRGNLEKIGGKRVLGRGSNGVSGTQSVMNYVTVFILRAVGRVLCQAGVLVTCASPKAKNGQRRTRGSWETSEEGQGKDMAGWGRGCGHGEILEVRLVSVVKAGSWAVGEEGTGTPGFLPLPPGCMYVCMYGEQGGGHGKMSLFPWTCKLPEAGMGPHTPCLSHGPLCPRGFQKTCFWLR